MECMRCPVCNYRGLQLAEGGHWRRRRGVMQAIVWTCGAGSAPVPRGDVDNSHDIMKESMKTGKWFR